MAPAPTGSPATGWPDLFIVGAATAGITSLWAYLDQHPDVFMAPVREPHHFSGIVPSDRLARFMPVVRDEASYLALFRDAAPGQVTGEASTSYLWSPEAPARIASVAPRARIVMVLRDPVERAWSHHWGDVAEGFERRSFLRSIRDEMERPGIWGRDSMVLGAGFYAAGLARFLHRFGPDRVRVFFFETFVADPRGTMRELFDWLGVDPGVADRLRPEPRDAGKEPHDRVIRRLLRGMAVARAGREPALDGTLRRLLEQLYAEDVRRVSDLVGVIPPWSVTPAR